MKLSDKAQNFKLGVYEHFKGMKVEVIGVGFDSENLKEMVIYKEGDNIWVRPIEMFLENIEKEGKIMPRFKYLN